MLVESHPETGDERRAVAAPLPHIIGNVQATAGSALWGVRPARGPCQRSAILKAGLMPAGSACCGSRHLTFSLKKEVKAADPNVTYLDDDNITYKDLEHGAFELVTKEAVPRHIIVEDPGGDQSS